MTEPAGPNPGDAWPVLLLIAAHRPPVPYQWLASRLDEGIRRGYEIAADRAQVVGVYDREAVRQYLDDLLRQLDSLGVVSLLRVGPTVSVQPVPYTGRRFWWSLVVTRMLAQMRPTNVAREVAESVRRPDGATVSERSVWRWMKGITTPNASDLAQIIEKHFASGTDSTFMTMLPNMVMKSIAQAENCGLTPAQKRRAEKWYQAELQPLADLIAELELRRRAKAKVKGRAG